LPEYRVESVKVTDLKSLRKFWLELQQRADCSFFQSWGWIGAWVEKVAAGLNLILIKVWDHDDLVGLGLFVTGDIKRHAIIHSRTMFLNEYPLEGKNMVIEYNGLLAARGCENTVYLSVVRFLIREFNEQDEFVFSAVTEDTCFNHLLDIKLNDSKFIIKESSRAWFVDLAGIPDNVDEYLATLSKNRRAQIRRSIRLYEREGALQISEAQNIEEAQAFYDGLKALHTQRWLSKGQPGSFANTQWEAFHRALIQNRFDTGEIQLLKVSHDSAVIGFLYNFVWRKHVYVLQTGFADSADKRLMPGYVTHVLAILYNKSKGLSVYDLMHGDSLYKKLLCNNSQKLLWVVLQRRRLSFLVEKLAVDMVRGLRKMTRCGY